MAKKKRSGGLSSQLADQASLEGQVKFGPEERALGALAEDVMSNYVNDVNIARGTAAGTQASVKAARPGMALGYLAGAGLSGRARSFTDPVVSGLQGQGGTTGTIMAALGRERQGGQTRLGEGLADALQGLTDRSVMASEGLTHQVQAAGSKRDSELEKIARRSQDIGSERGTFEAARIGTLADEAADRALEQDALDVRRDDVKADNARADLSLDETKRHNRASEKGKGGSKKTPRTGLGSLNQNQENALRGDLSTALSNVQRIKKGKGSYEQAIEYLSSGMEPNALGEGSPGIPRIKHRPLIDAAVQIDRDGHISAATVKELHGLGLHIPTKWRPKAAKPVTNSQADALGKLVRAALL